MSRSARATSRLPLVGQEKAVGFLESWLAGGNWPPLLFAGPAGVGKRTAALLLAQAANCLCDGPDQRPCGVCRSCRTIAQLSHPDLRLLLPIKLPKQNPNPDEVATATIGRYQEFALGQMQPVTDPKLKIPIDAVRWLRGEMARAPAQSRLRFFVLVQAHQMNLEASNALLKMLEEPQGQTTFVLTSDRPGFLLETIRSRCQMVRFPGLASNAVRLWLEENTGSSADDLELAVSISGGSLGTAVRFLESRDEFLVAPVVEYFSGRAGSNEAAVLQTLELTKDVSPAAITNTLLFLYAEAVRVRLGGVSAYASRNPDVMEKALGLEARYLRRVVKYLVSRSGEAGLNVNARLFNYTLLTTLRPPSTKSPAPKASRTAP